MITDREGKIGDIIGLITNGFLPEVDNPNKWGPSLYFYRKIMELRNIDNPEDITDFLADDVNIELLYATLVSWDMNSRGADMLYFDDFKESLLSCLDYFVFLENFQIKSSDDWEFYLFMLQQTYENLHVMWSNSRFVSNSKILHFLFPNKFMPMDGQNTLKYLYGNNHESSKRYIETFEFLYELLEILSDLNVEQYLDNMLNQSVPKLIDNAIMQIKKD